MAERIKLALTAVFVFLFCSGFKVGTHVASANRALDALTARVDFNSTNTDQLVFRVYDQDFLVDVIVKDAYRVILENPEYFKAGVVGPDGFVDLISGQTFQHGEESGVAKSLVSAATGGDITPETYADDTPLNDQNPPRPLEGRVHPSQYRSIDYAMLMLQHYQAMKALGSIGFGPIDTPKKQDQALAFTLGYIGHCVGDAFAHTYVNLLTGQGFDLFSGSGMLGAQTEEFQHTMLEGYFDSRVPGSLENTDGSEDDQFTRFEIRAPTAFLTSFFASRNSGQPEYGDPTNLDHLNTDLNANNWLKYFRNTDQFHGGPIYNYFNAQVVLGDAAENFGPVKEILEITAGLPAIPQTLEDVLLALDVPADVINDVTQWAAGDLLSFLTSPLVELDCNLVEIPEAFQVFVELWTFLATFDEKIDGYTEKARVARENYLKLSECTSQNLARIEGPDFVVDSDPTNDHLNRDACTILADRAAGGVWADNAPDGNGLVRGGVTDQVFLDEIIAHFRGQFTSQLATVTDAIGTEIAEDYGIGRESLGFIRALLYQGLTFGPYEPNSDHRSYVKNSIRTIEYLLGPGFLMDDFRDALIGTLPWNLFQAACDTLRDQGKRNCINVVLKGLAVAHEATGVGRCGVEWQACRAAGLQACNVAFCTAACTASTFGFGAPVCDDICETGLEATCRVAVNNICPEICIAPGCTIPVPYIGDVCTPLGPVASGVCTVADADCCLGFDPLGCEEAEDQICESRTPEQCLAFFTSLDCEQDLVEHCTERALNTVEEIFAGTDYAAELFDGFLEFCDIVEDPVGYFAEVVADEKEAIFEFVEARAPVLLGATASLAGGLAMQDALSVTSPAARVNFAFVNEDVFVDNAYRQALIARIDAVTANMIATGPPASPPVAVADYFLALTQGLPALRQTLASGAPVTIQFNPVTGPASGWGPQIAALELEAAKLRAALSQGVFEPTLPIANAGTIVGATLLRVQTDIGPDFQETFDPFFNTAHGLQLIPLTSQTDIENVLADSDVDTSFLPWADAQTRLPYSAACRNPLTTNIYCDVLISNDDPDFRNGTMDFLFERGGATWNTKRGLIPFDSDEMEDSVDTFFPLSTTAKAYTDVYQKIFRTPDDMRVRGVRRLFDFEEEDGWMIDQGDGTLVIDPSIKTNGAASTEIQGCNYISLTSRRFFTTALDPFSHTLTVDVFKPAPTGAVPWFGSLQLFASIPAANIYNAYLGQQELGPLPNGAWTSVNFTLTPEVFEAIAGDYPGMQLSFKLNTPCGAPLSDFYHLDNLRFTGDLTERTVFHQVGSRHLNVRTNGLFSFENHAEWSVPTGTNATLSPEIRRVEDGLAALRVNGAGWIPVNSVPFNTTSTLSGTLGPLLSIDVFVPNPQPEWYWVGDVRVELTCNGNNQLIGPPIPMTHFFEGEYNVAIFEIQPEALSMLQGDNNCVIRPVLNITGGPASGMFLLDRMGFLDDPGDCIGPACNPTCNDGFQNGSESGVDCGGPCPACGTCSDGVQNQGETGIDCGGPCPGCGGGGGGSCTAATAIDLGAPGTDVTVPNGGCVRVQNAYPSWWGTRVMRLENTSPGSYPVPFTWTNACSSSSGSGSYTGDWQAQQLSVTNAACATVIDLQGTGSGNITLRYYAQ